MDDFRSRAGEFARGLRACTDDEPTRPTGWAWFSDVMLGLAMAFAVMNSRPHHVNDFSPHLFYANDHYIGGNIVDILRALLTSLPLAFRRRYPLAVLWVTVFATLSLGVQAGNTTTELVAVISCLIAGYSALIHSPYRRGTIASLGLLFLMLLADHGISVPFGGDFVPLLLLVPVVLGANAVGNWRERVKVLEAQQESATQRAVEQERSRIATELHDVVTHNVSVMIVQAGAARKILDQSPELAREALLAVEASGRAAMAELRHVMGLLTMTSSGGEDAAAEADLAPQPGLDQLPALVDRIREAGVEIAYDVRGTAVPVPSGVDLAAYRVVQEALTNTVKHAQGARVQVTLAYAPDELRIDVADTGGARSPAAAGGNGRGLIGLRQRLDVYGGTLRAAPRISGGYRVSAMIPLSAPEV
jgi:signal transduction histidine kinase